MKQSSSAVVPLIINLPLSSVAAVGLLRVPTLMGVSKINSNLVIRNDLPLTRITKNLGKLQTTASCNVSPQPHSKAVPFSLCAEVQPYKPSCSDTASTVPLSHRTDPFVPSVIVTLVARPRYHQHDNDPNQLDGLIGELAHQYITSDSYENFI